MRRTRTILALTAVAALGLSACSGGGGEKDSAATKAPDKANTIVIGASPSPHAKILEYVRDNLAEKEGIKLEIKPFTDYVLPNKALESKDLDVNYYQTPRYLADQKKENPGYADFEAGKGIHLEPLALYPGKVKKLADLKDGATIGIISDPTNQSRGLELLAANDLIKLPEGADGTTNVAQIKADPKLNPRKFDFREIEGAALVRQLADLDAAVINGNFAQEGGLAPKDGLVVEKGSDDNQNVNLLVWRKDNANDPAIQKLEKLLHSPEVKAFIEKTWPDQSVIPAF